MAAYNLNGHCEDCTFADEYGISCKHGLLYPIHVMMTYGNMSRCPNFEKKNAAQLKEQIEKKNGNGKNA